MEEEEGGEIGLQGGAGAGAGGGGGGAVVAEEHLAGLAGLKRGKGYVEVTCGCTSAKYGDAVGRLRIGSDGSFVIACECTPGCDETALTPAGFERHAGNRSKKWKTNIWVLRHHAKVSLAKTPLLAYARPARAVARAPRRVVHRDEFVRCGACGKHRRFKRRDASECRLFHDAARNPNWRCREIALACVSEEERAPSRRAFRGCPRSASCPGCSACVCLGCPTCLFPDCPCRDCQDYYSANALAADHARSSSSSPS